MAIAKLYDAAGREVSFQSKPAYAVASNFTPPATPTDLIIIEGSATKTVRILSLVVSTQTTAAGSIELFLIKRSAADTGGTFVSAGTPAPLDANDAASSVNRVGHFTVVPGALGATVGTLARRQTVTPVLKPASWAGITQNSEVEMIPNAAPTLLARPIVLRGVAQTLAVNFNGVALVAGQIHQYSILWMEE